MNPAYRILKLQSGEEIITKILGKRDGKVSLDFPMAFRTVLMSDPYTGTQKEVTILRDWISYTADTSVKIPEDLIICYSSPLTEAISLYEKEKQKKVSDTKPKEIKNLDSIKKDMQNDFQTFLNDMIEQAEKINPADGFNNKSIADIFNSINALGPDDEVEWEFEFQFPSEEITDETTENEINHPDYGNRWTDWSSDPREY